MAEKNGTILDSTASFEGRLVGSDITVEGRFKGNLQVSGVLRIVQGSNIEASIKASRVEIGGKFQGDVQAETLHLLEQGRATGTFRAKKLSVQEGAKIDGDLEIGDKARRASIPDQRPSSP